MRFTKMQGVGNDFVVVDAAVLPTNLLLSELAVQACDRHTGIGADGLLVVSRDTSGAAFRMWMFNPDGTEDMCGNGLRCVSLWAYRSGWLNGSTRFTVATKEGLRAVSLLQASADVRSASLEVDMGTPHFMPTELPFCAPEGTRVVNYPLMAQGREWRITSVNTGSTHTVIFGEPPDEATFQQVSPLIENHPLFPERTTVLWATTVDDHTFAVRIWERGAGETLGCGTGACAVGVAAAVTGLSPVGEPLAIVSKGGTLQITWPGEDAAVDMIGPAEVVFVGDLAL